MYIPDTIGIERQKFFTREREFNNFTSLTEEDIAQIKADATDFVNRTKSHYETPYWQSTLYERVLEFINHQKRNSYYNTFDKKVIFLILALDPDLLMYKIYLSNGNDDKEYNKKLSVIGINDSKISRYEEIFFNHFLKDKTIIKGVKLNQVASLMSYTEFIKSFKSITDEKYESLCALAKKWSEENIYDEYNTTLSTAIFNIMAQHKLLGLNSLQEQFCFFILLIDPNLELLKIYEEESRIDNIKSRIKERFSFYHHDLIRVEKLYHERFCPDLEISPWQL